MSKNRLMKLIVGTTIILAAALAVQAFEPPDGAPAGNPTYIGMGDLRYIEAQTFASARAPEGNAAYSGIGDLRRFEAQQVNVYPGATAARHPLVGMGDLRRFEVQQVNVNPDATAARHPLVGMGDLRRFEAQQFLSNAVTKSTLLP